jgi:hypothetical protein
MILSGRLGRKTAAVAATFVTAAAFALPSAASAASFNFPLRGWWPLAEGQGQTIRDWSGRGNHGFLGELRTADSHDPKWVRGAFFGSALRFDGVDDYAQIPDSPDFRTQQLTLSLWFRGDRSPGLYKYLFARGGDACTATSYGLMTGFNGGLTFYTWDGSRQHLSGNLDASIWDGKWHHAAGTWDGVNSKLFVDGKLIGQGSNFPGEIDYTGPTGNAIVGGYHAGCDLLVEGDIDQVMIWSTPLAVDSIWRNLSLLFNRPASS